MNLVILPPPSEAADEAERSVLAEVIAHGECLARVRQTGLEPKDFQNERGRVIFAAVLRLDEQGRAVDANTLIDELEQRGDLNRAGGRAGVFGLAEQSVTPLNAEDHARIVIRAGRHREGQQLLRRAELLSGRDPGTAQALAKEAAARFEEATAAASELKSDAEQEAAQWPDPLAEEALHGLAGDIVRAIDPTTEADQVAILLQLLAFFGSAAGRTPHFLHEDTRHGLNEYVLLVGATSKARKGTSEKRVRNLFKRAAPEFMSRIKSGLTSGEGVIWEMRDPIRKLDMKTGKVEVDDPGQPDKRLLVVEGEFASVLKKFERDGSSLSPVMRVGWDGDRLDTLVSERSKAKAVVEEPHLAIVGHITADELTRSLSRTEMANGLGNRFLLACVKRSKYLPFGGGVPAGLNEIVMRLHDAVRWAHEIPAPIEMDLSARRVWEAIYSPLSDGKPGLRGAMLARGEAHVRRLAAIYAVLDLVAEVRREHLLAALAVWDYVEASVRYVFRDASLGDPDADAVLAAVRESGEAGISRTELAEHFGRHWKGDRLASALALLEERSLISSSREGSGRGRPAMRYRASDLGFWEGHRGYLELARNV